MEAVHFALGAAFVAAVGCNAIETPPTPPANTCPSSPCSAYVQAGAQPICTSGACLVSAPATGLVIVVNLPLTAGYAPGSTFAALYDQFLVDASTRFIQGCSPPTCASLPPFVAVQGAYLIDAFAAMLVNFPLGNRGGYTALPAQMTFRLLWPPASGASGFTAEAQGLPIEPIQPAPIANPITADPGPVGGPSLGFRAFLQAGAYEVVLRPTPPFDTVFGPEVAGVTLASTGSVVSLPGTSCLATNAQLSCVDGFDATQETGHGDTLPAFDIARANGLAGWTVYLRDLSRTIISNVVPLNESPTHVVLATHHVPTTSADALTGTALVIAPPAGAPYPTAVFAPIGNVLPSSETYPALPAPSVISGSVVADDGTPIAADLVFEALSITDANGISNSANFEFAETAHARLSGSFGLPTYSIELPQGSYRLSVRPLDPVHQVTVLSPFVVTAQNDPVHGNVEVASLRAISGSAVVADGRALSDAEVDAEPSGCAVGSSLGCMPREASATTGANGSFQLSLDPGKYLLRVRPAEGTRLPWTSLPLSLGAADPPTTIAPIAVPAPVAAGLRLLDPNGAPISLAQVRYFSMSPGSPAIEVGRALTGGDGTFEMYLLPSGQ